MESVTPNMQPIFGLFGRGVCQRICDPRPRCATSQAPRSASAKATLSGLPDADVPLDFVKEIKEIKGITQGLVRDLPAPGQD